MKLAIGLVLIAAVIGLVLFKGTGSTTNQQNVQSMQVISDDINQGALLIDVRTPQEFAAGHIEGSDNLPLQSIQDGQMPNVPKTTKLYVYCQSGNRSAQATAALKAAGYENIEDLGGINEVVQIGGKKIRS